MTIILKTKIKWPINVKLSAINHISQHLLKKKSLDNILLDTNEHIATKRMVNNTFQMFDYSWLPKVEIDLRSGIGVVVNFLISFLIAVIMEGLMA